MLPRLRMVASWLLSTRIQMPSVYAVGLAGDGGETDRIEPRVPVAIEQLLADRGTDHISVAGLVNGQRVPAGIGRERQVREHQVVARFQSADLAAIAGGRHIRARNRLLRDLDVHQCLTVVDRQLPVRAFESRAHHPVGYGKL